MTTTRTGALLIYNPASGTGQGSDKALELREALMPLGVSLDLAELGTPLDADDPRPVLIGGGDGTVRALLDDLARTRRPCWHLPWGTANLFGKSLGTAFEDPIRLAGAIRIGRTLEIDIGRVDAHAFACCASTGPDAEALTRREGEDRGLMTYVLAFVSSVGTPRLPTITIESEGQTLIAQQRGALLIANSSRHVGFTAPVPGASMLDGRLDLAFIPAGSGAKLLHWLGELVLTGRLDEQHIPRAAVRSATVTSHDEPFVLQADGELILAPDDGRRSFEVTVQPAAVRALVEGATG